MDSSWRETRRYTETRVSYVRATEGTYGAVVCELIDLLRKVQAGDENSLVRSQKSLLISLSHSELDNRRHEVSIRSQSV